MEFGRHHAGSWDTQGVPFFSVMMVGFVVVSLFNVPVTKPRATALSSSDCQTWDQDALGGITQLINDTSATGSQKLSEALAQLHRARVYCGGGIITLAQDNYASLHRAFPLTTGSAGAPRNAPTVLPVSKTSLPN